MKRLFPLPAICLLLLVFASFPPRPSGAAIPEPRKESDFYAFESGPVRPVSLTPDGNRLLVLNIPAGLLEVFNLEKGVHEHSVPVGMEPVAAAARTDTEVWVVNKLSDSVRNENLLT